MSGGVASGLRFKAVLDRIMEHRRSEARIRSLFGSDDDDDDDRASNVKSVDILVYRLRRTCSALDRADDDRRSRWVIRDYCLV